LPVAYPRWVDAEPEHLWPKLWLDKLHDLKVFDTGCFRNPMYSARVEAPSAPAEETPVVVKEFPAYGPDVEVAHREIANTKALGGGDVAKLFDDATFQLPQDEIGSKLLLLEGASSTLQSVIERGSHEMPLSALIGLMVELLRGAKKISEAGYVHRNIEPATIFVRGDCRGPKGCHAKLTGLGYAVDFREDQTKATVIPMAKYYVAPEVWEGEATPASDVWSLGLVFYEMIVGDIPVDLYREQPGFLSGSGPGMYLGFDIYRDIDLMSFSNHHPDIGDLIAGMARREPRLRLTVDQALKRAEAIADKWGVRVPEQPTVQLPPSWYENP